MDTYTYPTNVELREIERDLIPTLEENDPIFQHFPTATRDTHIIQWEIRDNIKGMQAVRGLNASPIKVRQDAASRYTMEPGVYGEFAPVDEQELTIRRPYGTFNGSIDITDLIRDRQDLLLSREIARRRWILWTLLTTGQINVLNERGSVIHTADVSVRTYTAGVPWATVATAVPLANFRAVALLSRGSSCIFDQGAFAFVNRATANDLMGNTNSSDLGTRLKVYGEVPSLAEFNRIFLDQGLPQIVVMDDGYLDEDGVFQLFIPNNKCVVIGRRTTGEPLGEYIMTRNANNVDMGPGSYVKVFDDVDCVPRKLEVHRGHNGGPALYYPNGVCVMTV